MASERNFISKLPVEITSEIFTLCLPSVRSLRDFDSSDEQWGGEHIFAPPYGPTSMILSKICRSWREISFSTPALWSTVPLDLNETPEKVLSSMEMFASIVDEWISRSHRQPLSFIIRAELVRETPHHPLLDSLFSAYSPRIQSLQIFSDEEVLPELEFSGSFPALREVALQYSGFPPPAKIGILGDAIQLHKVHLLGWSVESFFLLPWSSLTTFMGEISTMDIFRFAPGLIDATVSLTADNPIFEHESGLVITHRTLRSLAFFSGERGFDDPSIEALEFLTLPALENLHVLQIFDTAHVHDTLSTFLSRSSPPLRTLSLSFDHLPPGLNLSSLPSLQSLRLATYGIWTDLEQPILTLLEAVSKEYLPNFEELRFVEREDPKHRKLVDLLTRLSSASKVRPLRLICEHGRWKPPHNPNFPSDIVENLTYID
ncbi:hypothetical protein B0H16DRAFT_1540049 [Mycena metata]|uniref:F-box domain-containing protein n=1 Tax=Mycena metata TaxID=1033252 RepID=A0AAD7J316_9AGAR|nr:hypothetical protein B0H16DRAFT_1540049 [Mycena metata]